ncbi:MAG: inositol monophosphatase family protein [Planctomycetota bacterium]|nr:inositol monophosphatase family protein [Planctomycetota bacterium]
MSRSEVVRVARSAGDILRAHYGTLSRANAAYKEGERRNLVSQADLEAERHLLSCIPEKDDVLSEEGNSRDRGAARKWVIDPLDGTVNFLHRIPFWAVSVALIEDGALVAGAVHAPVLDETFSAGAGEGAFLNDERIRVSGTAELGDAILATGFAYGRDTLPDRNVDNFSTLVLASAGIRRMGAAAIDLAYVACGRLDGFWELHLNAWDVAAGILLVREAGGRVTDFLGGDALDSLLFSRHILATNGPIHASVKMRLAPLKAL